MKKHPEIEGSIDFAVQISGELFFENCEALVTMARVIKEHGLFEFFLEKLRESDIREKEKVVSFFERL